MNNYSTKIKELPKEKIDEIVEGINTLCEKDISVSVCRTKVKPEEEFVFYFLTNMNALMSDPQITKQDLMILMQYATKMKYGNQLSISQLDIAEDLGIDKSRVSNSVKKLTKRGIFYKEGRSLFMNWKYLAKGNLTDFIKAEREKERALRKVSGFTSLHFLFFVNVITWIASCLSSSIA